MAKQVPTPDEIRTWPATVDVPTAGRAFGIGRDESYRLVRENRFPVPVLRLGRYLRVTRAALLDALGITEHHPTVTPFRNEQPIPVAGNQPSTMGNGSRTGWIPLHHRDVHKGG
jgi:hypothetical protein